MAGISCGARPILFCTYQQKSIKNVLRPFRGSSQRYILKSSDTKLPADMQRFLIAQIKKRYSIS